MMLIVSLRRRKPLPISHFRDCFLCCRTFPRFPFFGCGSDSTTAADPSGGEVNDDPDGEGLWMGGGSCGCPWEWSPCCCDCCGLLRAALFSCNCIVAPACCPGPPGPLTVRTIWIGCPWPPPGPAGPTTCCPGCRLTKTCC